jgi:hypothetical protein
VELTEIELLAFIEPPEPMPLEKLVLDAGVNWSAHPIIKQWLKDEVDRRRAATEDSPDSRTNGRAVG